VIVPEPNFWVWPVTVRPSRLRSVLSVPEPKGRISVVEPSDHLVIVPEPNFWVWPERGWVRLARGGVGSAAEAQRQRTMAPRKDSNTSGRGASFFMVRVPGGGHLRQPRNKTTLRLEGSNGGSSPTAESSPPEEGVGHLGELSLGLTKKVELPAVPRKLELGEAFLQEPVMFEINASISMLTSKNATMGMRVSEAELGLTGEV